MGKIRVKKQGNIKGVRSHAHITFFFLSCVCGWYYHKHEEKEKCVIMQRLYTKPLIIKAAYPFAAAAILLAFLFLLQSHASHTHRER